MSFGIGVDLTRISRISELIARRGVDRFSRWILSPQEQNSQVDAQYLATRWAVKEALFKACYPHHRLQWQQVTLLKGAGGEPVVHIKDVPVKAQVSISHEGDLVIATALVVKS